MIVFQRYLAGALLVCSFTLTGCGSEPDAAARVNAVADKAYEFTIRNTPEIAYFSGVKIERHDGLEDNSPEAMNAADRTADALLKELRSIDPSELDGRSEWVTYALLYQHLKSSVAQRICRKDLWNVDQMSGWHLRYTQVAALQPTGTVELREQSIERWSKFDDYIDQEIEHLEKGLERGYSAPRPAVERVIAQVDGILRLEVDQSPYFSPAARDDDEAFTKATRQIVADQISPALSRYRDYLQNDYLEQAREDLSVTANPDGLACYEASLRAYTTIDRSGNEVYELGQQAVSDNMQEVVRLGRDAYGLEDFAEIIEAATNDPDDKFTSKEELLEYSTAAVERAEQAMPAWVGTMPDRRVIVVPFPPEEEGTGRSAHYRPGNEERPGEYRIPLFEAEKQSRGMAEAIAFHETWPGHHLQVAASQSMQGLHPVTNLIWFSGPGEGWARYAESLAAEMGLYENVTGQILRTAWRARGMVVDPGLHLFDWSRDEAKTYLMASGNYTDSEAEDMIDRISIIPGQLTSYDSGGLEIVALRRLAEEKLGDEFDLGEFHDRVLEYGTIPLGHLRQHIESWLSDRP